MEGCVPWDLIVEILCRLPVKSLVRFSYVSKRWRSEISNPNFIRLHLKRSSQASTHSSLVIVDGRKLSLVDLSNPLPIPKEVDDSLNSLSGKFIELLGMCDGLLCMSTYDYNTIVLWNMSTGEHLTLLLQPDLGYYRKPLVGPNPLFGFGYDPINDDYKVIRIYQSFALSFGLNAVSYSLRSKSWKEILGLCY
ncbi:hypothetical protein V6N13_015012 [Hibiscus sabdariffa]|uniref:F-box domain-containing protein n=1 Tax=Hibiscus sabdariffa TaxID=183260 RepID=A0ABR2RX87_9ROSI